MVLRAQWPLGTIAQFFHFVAEEKNKQKKNKGILWLGYHRYPSNYKRLEKKQTINSWKRHALCDAVLSYESNRWKFIVRGTKYGRFTTINISKYEHFTRKINRICSHLVCTLCFPAFFAVLSLICHHSYSCYKTKVWCWDVFQGVMS